MSTGGGAGDTGFMSDATMSSASSPNNNDNPTTTTTTREERASRYSRENSMEDPIPERGSMEDEDLADYERRHTSNEEDYVNLPPGRMHATRVKERLSGSGGNLQIPPGLANVLLRKRLDASSMSPRSSRSRSPSVLSASKGLAGGGGDKGSVSTTMDANSSISSLEDIVDQDILYDRAGLCGDVTESDVLSERKKLHNSGREFSNLTPVCERSSEDTMEDVHAFADPVVVRSSNASRTNSIGTGNDQFLEPLNEDSEEDDLDDITEEDENEQTQVIVTNLDNIAFTADDHDRMAARAGTRGGTGESSLVEEAPSAPTA